MTLNQKQTFFKKERRTKNGQKPHVAYFYCNYENFNKKIKKKAKL